MLLFQIILDENENIKFDIHLYNSVLLPPLTLFYKCYQLIALIEYSIMKQAN